MFGPGLHDVDFLLQQDHAISGKPSVPITMSHDNVIVYHHVATNGFVKVSEEAGDGLTWEKIQFRHSV